MDRLLQGMLVPTPPRCTGPDRAGSPPGLGDPRLEALGEAVARLRPEGIVLAAAHRIATFPSAAAKATPA